MNIFETVKVDMNRLLMKVLPEINSRIETLEMVGLKKLDHPVSALADDFYALHAKIDALVSKMESEESNENHEAEPPVSTTGQTAESQ